MPAKPNRKKLVANVRVLTGAQLAAELKRRAKVVKAKVRRLEEAKTVKQETMQIEVSI